MGELWGGCGEEWWGSGGGMVGEWWGNCGGLVGEWSGRVWGRRGAHDDTTTRSDGHLKCLGVVILIDGRSGNRNSVRRDVWESQFCSTGRLGVLILFDGGVWESQFCSTGGLGVVNLFDGRTDGQSFRASFRAS